MTLNLNIILQSIYLIRTPAKQIVFKIIHTEITFSTVVSELHNYNLQIVTILGTFFNIKIQPSET